MKVHWFPIKLSWRLAVVLLLVGAAGAQPTAFTYQGSLRAEDHPAIGTYDFTFTLWDAATGGGILGGPVTNLAVDVSGGCFTTSVDFGPGGFGGAKGWLAIGVRRNGVDQFAALAARQPVTSAPQAIYAATALTTAGPISAGQLAGTIPVGRVTGAISPSNLPPPVVTNGAFGLMLTGAFSGDGAGLTNLPANLKPAGPLGMALVPAGSFVMGNVIGDPDISNAPPTTVYVSAFYMDVNLVTWSQWVGLYAWATNNGYSFVNPGAGKAPNHPAQLMDWFDCVKWCNARSEQAGRTPVYYANANLTQVYRTGEGTVYPNWSAVGYRLPTEAEWEKAARGGLAGLRFPWGDFISHNLANYDGSVGMFAYDFGPNGFVFPGSVELTNVGTTPVGSYAPNEYGLYDMAGNLFAWCWDWYNSGYPGGTDPRGPASSNNNTRVVRGGNWFSYGFYCRCADRNRSVPTLIYDRFGLRTVLAAGQ